MDRWDKLDFFVKGKNYLGIVDKQSYLLEIAKCYCNIWKEPPWCEDFWEPEVVSGDISEQLLREGAIGIFAVNYQESIGFGMKENHGRVFNCQQVIPGGWTSVFGFCWGYEVASEELYLLSGQNENEWCRRNVVLSERLFYIDELGVAKYSRRKGLGLLITNLIIFLANLNSYKTFILRTDVNAVPAIELYLKLGFNLTGIRDAKHPNREYLIRKVDLPTWTL